MATILLETFSPVAFFLPRFAARYKKEKEAAYEKIAWTYSQDEIDDAFTKAEHSNASAKADLKALIKGELGKDARKVGIDNINFVEFDSGNITHANAVYHAVLVGPERLLRRVAYALGYTSHDDLEIRP